MKVAGAENLPHVAARFVPDPALNNGYLLLVLGVVNFPTVKTRCLTLIEQAKCREAKPASAAGIGMMLKVEFPVCAKRRVFRVVKLEYFQSLVPQFGHAQQLITLHH